MGRSVAGSPTGFQIIQVPVSVAGFALRRVAEQPGDIRKSLNVSLLGEI